MYKRGSFTDKYRFDPHFWLQTADVKDRIAASGKDAIQISSINPDGTYSYTWYFNTVVIPNVWQTYMLRTLEINGEAIAVPFFESVENNNPNVSAETTLSTGTRVRLTLTRVEKDWLTPQSGVPFNSYLRYYRLNVENAAESLTITGGAVTTAVSQQNVLSAASGVKVQYAIRQSANTSQWTDKQQGDITRASALPSDGELGYRRYSTGTDKKFQGNVRFRLLPGFHTSENMTVFRNSSGTPIRLDAYAGPDSEGWYYLKLNPNTTDAIHPTSLEIKAAPNRYAVRYLPGDPGVGQVEHMPEFAVSDPALPPHTDSNGGSFYLLSGASANSDTTVPIAGAPTNNATVPAAFLTWALTDSDGKPVPGTASISFSAGGTASLRSLMDYAVYDSSSDLWIISLTAQWEDNLFRYFIDLQWDTPDGTAHVKSNAAVVSTASGAQREGQKLRFVLSKGADVITDFLESHPGYRLSDDNDYLFYVADNEHVTIKFEQISAGLSVAKRLLDENREEVPSVREFPINLTLSYPEGVLAPDGTGLSGQPLGADYDGDYPYTVTDADGQTAAKMLALVGGRGSFFLKPGETASFPQLPANTVYDIREESSEDFTVEYAEKSGTLQASAAARATVTNRRNVSLTIRKLAVGGSAEPGEKWNFTVTMKDGEDTETDTFTLGHNESFMLKGWPSGTTYTVTETDANQDGYETTVTGAETAAEGIATGVLRDAEAANGITVTYTNANASGNLILSKIVAGNGSYAAREFTFDLTLTAPAGKSLKESYTYIAPGGEQKELELTGNASAKTGVLILRHNETIVLEDLSGGTGYTITERPIPDLVPPYQVMHTVNSGKPQEGNTVSGTIPHASGSAEAENTGIVFANIREVKNALTISKMVDNGESEPTETQKAQSFSFSITLTGTELAESYPFTDALGQRGVLQLSGDAENRTGSFRLTHGSAISIEGLPTGIQYQITEDAVPGYTTEQPANSSGTLGERPVRVDFINHAEPSVPSNLTLVKRQLVDGKDVGEQADVQAGDTVTYELTLANSDAIPVENIVLADEVPSGLLLDESSISNEGRKTGNTVVWTFPILDAQQEKTVRFRVTVPSDSGNTSTVWTNQALARSDDDLEEPGSPGMALNILSNPVTLQLKKSGDTPCIFRPVSTTCTVIQSHCNDEKEPPSRKVSQSYIFLL